jgi:hypothetical protein
MKKHTGPTKTGVMGRWSIFRPKINDADHRYQGWLTDFGRMRFEQAREELSRLFWSVFGRDAVSTSDADTIEYLARGRSDTLKYLRRLAREEAKAEKKK